jgi:Ca2+-binding EF-hand superfamily protein
MILQSVTEMFRAEDQDQDGVIQIDYEKFLLMILNSNLL